jgi:ribosomal protein S18 acetylase RimI-like enzyme
LFFPLEPRLRARVCELIGATPEFGADDQPVAIELVDAALTGSTEYRFFVDVEDDEVRGYVCYGPTPMTQGTYDLYWIAVAPRHKGKGIGRALVRRVEDELRAAKARLVRVETEGTADYAATRGFYDALGYRVVATIPDFYRPGSDLVVYARYLD